MRERKTSMGSGKLKKTRWFFVGYGAAAGLLAAGTAVAYAANPADGNGVGMALSEAALTAGPVGLGISWAFLLVVAAMGCRLYKRLRKLDPEMWKSLAWDKWLGIYHYYAPGLRKWVGEEREDDLPELARMKRQGVFACMAVLGAVAASASWVVAALTALVVAVARQG